MNILVHNIVSDMICKKCRVVRRIKRVSMLKGDIRILKGGCIVCDDYEILYGMLKLLNRLIGE